MKTIQPRTHTQRVYLECIAEQALTFGVGPAGTGKTYLAIAAAVLALRNKQVSRIVVSRPAVEAGERLGFLPGTLDEKLAPYLRPVYDALHDLWAEANIASLVSQGAVEVAPLAFMRGRTLSNAFVVLDEAQNTTIEQMKMFLTRLGHGTKMVVTGDPSQVDLHDGQRSGLHDALEVLKGVGGVAVCEFSAGDVQRHPLVRAIVKAYDRKERDSKE